MVVFPLLIERINKIIHQASLLIFNFNIQSPPYEFSYFLFSFTEYVSIHIFKYVLSFPESLKFLHADITIFRWNAHRKNASSSRTWIPEFQKSKVLLFDLMETVLAVIHVKTFILLLDQLLRVWKCRKMWFCFWYLSMLAH